MNIAQRLRRQTEDAIVFAMFDRSLDGLLDGGIEEVGGEIALLVRMRNAAAEREMKLHFLPAASTPDPALLLRRSAN